LNRLTKKLADLKEEKKKAFSSIFSTGDSEIETTGEL
jgi:hypothetical protein